MRDNLPVEIRTFLKHHVTSVEQLEILLLLHQSRPRAWGVAELSRFTRGNETATAHWLSCLVATGLAIRGADVYQFQVDSDELTTLTGLLGTLYRESMPKVIEFIYAKPDSQIVDFSEAFKFRKRP